MVIVNLMYGLANQMFQYAAAKALALRNAQELRLDISSFTNSDQNQSHEVFSLQIFNGISEQLIMLSAQVSELRRKYEHDNWYKNVNRVRKRLGLTPMYNYVWEKEFLNFDSNILHQTGNHIYLTGYFQNEQYFADAALAIRQDFQFRLTSISPLNQELGKQMANEESVAVHIRRGDYVGNRYVAPISYYEAALAYLSKHCHKPVFYFFSDDPEWTKAHLRIAGKHQYLSHNTSSESYQDMFLMSCCRHNIIANSSFSWWGAWLNTNKQKIIVAPSKWLPEKGIMSSQIVPPNWFQVLDGVTHL